MSLFNIIKNNSQKFSKKIALIIGEKEFSYKEFFELILQTIKNLKKNNFQKGDTVLLIEDNNIEHILSLFALSYINCTIVPSGTYYQKNHLTDIIKLTKVNAIIGNAENCHFFKKNLFIKKFLCTSLNKNFPFFFSKCKKKLNLKKKIDIKKNFIITFSSGSTSQPKPIVYSQQTKIIRYRLFKKLYNINTKDIISVTSPIDHSLGMRTLYVPLLCGATCVVMHKFNVINYFELTKKYNVSFSVLIANQIYELVKNKKLFKNFNLKKGLISASTKLFPSVKNSILKKKINLYEMYGAAEIGTVTSINLRKNKKFFKSVGKKYHKKIDIKIISNENKFLENSKIGEIVAKTPGKFKNYYKSKILNNVSFYKGYFKTGDIGYLDKFNYLYFLSRKKNIYYR